MTQKSNSCEVFSFFYQKRNLDNNSKNAEKNSNTTANISAAVTSNLKDKKICICELKHQFQTCYYLIESLQSKNWKPDPNIQKQIDEKLEKNKSLKTIIQKLQETVKKTVTEMSVTSAADIKSKKFRSFACFVSVKLTDYHLHDSFILNSVFNTHICNNQSRIYDFQSVKKDDILYIRNSILTILDYELIKIIIQSSLSSFNIILCEVIFISIFHINLVILNCLINKKMHFES